MDKRCVKCTATQSHRTPLVWQAAGRKSHGRVADPAERSKAKQDTVVRTVDEGQLYKLGTPAKQEVAMSPHLAPRRHPPRGAPSLPLGAASLHAQ